MKKLSIDIETYSINDLTKSGVYKYVEAPDFEILLFGYSEDDGEVRVVDLACGELIPEKIVAALSDENVTKWAFNAQFERICLSAYLRKHYPQYIFSYSIPEDELQPLVDSWRAANPKIVQFWWDVDRCVKETVRKKKDTETHGIRFSYQSGMMFITLPSGRRLAYVKPRMGENRFGGESVTYEGVGGNKKWERIESYGPKFVENIVQAISRDILCYAMRTLSHCFIVGHVHDELIMEFSRGVSVDVVCEQMSRTPPWVPGLILNAAGFEAEHYKKD